MIIAPTPISGLVNSLFSFLNKLEPFHEFVYDDGKGIPDSSARRWVRRDVLVRAWTFKYRRRHYVIDLYELEGSDRNSGDIEYRLNVSGLDAAAGPGCVYSTLSSEEAIRFSPNFPWPRMQG